MNDELTSVQHQLTQAETNLRLIRERKAEYVLSIEVPLHLVKEERALEECILTLTARLLQLQASRELTPTDAAPLLPDGMQPPADDQVPPLPATPFIVGPPITHPRAFFGRERAVRRLFDLLRRPPLQNAAIIGPRRSGKTSLLHYLRFITTTPPEQLRPGQRHDWLTQPETYHWVYLDFQDARLGTRQGLLHALLTHLQLPPPAPQHCTLDYFLDIVSRSLRTPTILLLDEIGVALERYPELDDAFWESLRSLATTQVNGNLAFILAAAEPPDQLAHHTGHGSPFFNIFGYTTTLGALSEAEAQALIASSPIPFPDEDIAWILARSGRIPILLQILCRERLAALEMGEAGDEWRDEALLQMQPFRYLLS